MLKTYLRIAFRNLSRYKVFSSIQIVGFAVGLATCLLITLFVTDELRYDRYNEKADRIYRVNAHFRLNGEMLDERLSPAPLGPALVSAYADIEQTVRIGNEGNILIQKGQENILEPNSCFADSSLFDVFTLPMLAGNPKTALKEPQSMVITESMAKKYFTGVDAGQVIGKTLLVNNKTAYTITGVMKDMPAQSHIHFNFIRSLAGDRNSRNNFWLDNPYVTYVLAREGTSQQTVEAHLKEITAKFAEPQMKEGMNSSFADLAKRGDYYQYLTIPLTKIHLYSTLAREAEPSGNSRYIYIFIVTAVIILLIACVNFMNLSTARSAGRSKEVGVRKVLGSKRSSLIAQFLTESVLISLVALILAVIIVLLVLPYYNRLSGKQMQLGLFSFAWVLPALLLSAVVTGLLAGSYPAFFLSAFRPIQVLKGRLVTGFKGSWLRNSLVVFQFTAAIILIVCTLVIYNQLNYIRNKDLGYNRDQILLLHNTELLANHARMFKDEALKIPGVQHATMADVLPVSNETHTDVFFKSAEKGTDKSISLESWFVDADFIPTFKIKMVKGRNFSPDLPTDSSAVLINETAARMLGYTDPLNNQLYQPGGDEEGEDEGKLVARHIIGVVKDFNAGSLHAAIPPIVFNLADERSNMAFRINAKNTAAIIAAIENKYHAMNKAAGLPFMYSFMDESFNKLYQSEQRTGSIFIAFTAAAILVACMGLFGLVTYAAEQRTREIGIRKVLGAGVAGIVRLLSGDFFKLVSIAALIAFPVAWWVMHQWLQDFAYRTSIGIWVFVVAGMVAIALTLLTVGFRAIKAATANPVNSLRNE